jgi:hypothetical protein
MGLDGADGQDEVVRDLGIRMAERDQPQHLELAAGERVAAGGERTAVPDRGAERAGGRVLGQPDRIPAGRARMVAHDHDAGVERRGEEPCDKARRAVAALMARTDHDGVGPAHADERDSRRGVLGLADDADLGVARKQAAQRAARERVAPDDQHRYGLLRGHGGTVGRAGRHALRPLPQTTVEDYGFDRSGR